LMKRCQRDFYCAEKSWFDVSGSLEEFVEGRISCLSKLFSSL